jgi:adenosylcobyric acid synthase
VIPYLNGLSLPAEDSLGIGGSSAKPWDLDVAVVRLPRIANFTDIHILAEEEGVRVRYVTETSELGQPHIIILPGTKNTLSDLTWLKDSGLAGEILGVYRRGAYVMGICGGYQMLGRKVSDLSGLDGRGGAEAGLGLLTVETEFLPEKTADRVSGQTIQHGEALEGYEIHMGRTHRLEGEAFARVTGETGQTYEDGATDCSGRVLGTYLHGIFDSPDFRLAYLNRVRETFKLPQQTRSGKSAREKRESSYSMLSQAVSEHLDNEFLLNLLQQQRRK